MGIIVGDDLMWIGHVDRIVGKANMIMRMLKITFASKDLGVWKDLYVSLVPTGFRPHYVVQT